MCKKWNLCFKDVPLVRYWRNSWSKYVALGRFQCSSASFRMSFSVLCAALCHATVADHRPSSQQLNPCWALRFQIVGVTFNMFVGICQFCIAGSVQQHFSSSRTERQTSHKGNFTLTLHFLQVKIVGMVKLAKQAKATKQLYFLFLNDVKCLNYDRMLDRHFFVALIGSSWFGGFRVGQGWWRSARGRRAEQGPHFRAEKSGGQMSVPESRILWKFTNESRCVTRWNSECWVLFERSASSIGFSWRIREHLRAFETQVWRW